MSDKLSNHEKLLRMRLLDFIKLIDIDYDIDSIANRRTGMTNDLLYCPFCGDEEAPRMMIRKGRDGWRDRFFVRCEYDNGGCGAESGWYHSEEEAKFSWNTRAKKDG